MVPCRIVFSGSSQPTGHVCPQCGAESPRWFARCPQCSAWSKVSPDAATARAEARKTPRSTGHAANRPRREDELAARRGALAIAAASASSPSAASATEIDLTDDGDDVVRISELSSADHARRSTGIEPLDRVLGGRDASWGLVVGGSIMVSGGPGAGKTTLLSQMIASVRRPDGSPCEVVLWASAEETPAHIRLRAERIGVATSSVEIYAQKRDVDRVIAHARKRKVEVLVVDSIQTIVTHDLASLAGSTQQCLECARRLDAFGKETGCSVVIICQINKSGQSAGPKAIEHLVDATFSIKTCDEFPSIRYLSAEKNRFGSVTEVGSFEMTEFGMTPLADQDAASLATPADRDDAMLPIAQELLQRLLELGGVVDAGLRDRIAGRLDLTPRGAS